MGRNYKVHMTLAQKRTRLKMVQVSGIRFLDFLRLSFVGCATKFYNNERIFIIIEVR